MKAHLRPSLAVLGTFAVMLTGCTSGAPTPAVTVAAPAAAAAANEVSASVRVEPASTANLSFLISAPVRQMLVSEGQAVRAGQELILLDAPQLEYALTAAEAALTSATEDEFIQSQGRRKIRNGKVVWDAGPPEQRRAAHARVLQAQAGVEAARAQLAQSVLLAPFDGTVASINVRPGEVVQPGQVVAVMGDLANFQIETTDLSERDIARVRAGQKALIRLKALETDLSGTVAAIDPLAGESEDGDVIYKVTIALERQSPDLFWGMTGDVRIQVGT